jgi:hypothetical protein
MFNPGILSLQFESATAPAIRHPDVCPVEGDLEWKCPEGESFEHSAIVCSQFHHIVAVLIRHPDVRSAVARALDIRSYRTFPVSAVTMICPIRFGEYPFRALNNPRILKDLSAVVSLSPTAESLS